MISLGICLTAWGTPRFKEALREALQRLDAAQLPLQQGLTHSSHVGSGPLSILVHGADDDEHTIRARVGIFYTGVIAGCNCADDPSPADEINEYCELQVVIDKSSGAATLSLSS